MSHGFTLDDVKAMSDEQIVYYYTACISYDATWIDMMTTAMSRSNAQTKEQLKGLNKSVEHMRMAATKQLLKRE